MRRRKTKCGELPFVWITEFSSRRLGQVSLDRVNPFFCPAFLRFYQIIVGQKRNLSCSDVRTYLIFSLSHLITILRLELVSLKPFLDPDSEYPNPTLVSQSNRTTSLICPGNIFLYISMCSD